MQQLEDYTGKVLPRIRCHVLSLHDFSNFWKKLLVHKGKILSGEDMLQEERKGVDMLLAWGQ